MEFLRVSPEAWSQFFAGVTERMQSKLVEVEVVGLDVGDQVEAEWVPLIGVSYEPDEDAVRVIATTADGPLDHSIVRPREVFVELGSSGVNLIVVIDDEGGKQFLRLRSPLELPEDVFPPAA